MSKTFFGVAVILFQQHVKNQPDIIKMWTCYMENIPRMKHVIQRQEGKLCVYVPPPLLDWRHRMPKIVELGLEKNQQASQ